MATKVYVDPACNILYSSFYIEGLRQLYGYNNVVFCSKPFKALRYGNENFLLAFVIEGNKYIIALWILTRFNMWILWNGLMYTAR